MKHKYILSLITVFLLTVLPIAAQEQQKRHFDIDKFKKQKAEFIVSEVGLNDAEAKIFIPLVNELMDKKFELNRATRKDMRELKEKKTKSDEDYNRLIEAGFDTRNKELQLDKEYYQKFRKVLSPEKIYKYQKAENKFMKNIVGENKSKARSGKK